MSKIEENEKRMLEDMVCKMTPEQCRRHFRIVQEIRNLGFTESAVRVASIEWVKNILNDNPNGIELMMLVIEPGENMIKSNKKDATVEEIINGMTKVQQHILYSLVGTALNTGSIDSELFKPEVKDFFDCLTDEQILVANFLINNAIEEYRKEN